MRQQDIAQRAIERIFAKVHVNCPPAAAGAPPHEWICAEHLPDFWRAWSKSLPPGLGPYRHFLAAATYGLWGRPILQYAEIAARTGETPGGASRLIHSLRCSMREHRSADGAPLWRTELLAGDTDSWGWDQMARCFSEGTGALRFLRDVTDLPPAELRRINGGRLLDPWRRPDPQRADEEPPLHQALSESLARLSKYRRRLLAAYLGLRETERPKRNALVSSSRMWLIHKVRLRCPGSIARLAKQIGEAPYLGADAGLPELASMFGSPDDFANFLASLLGINRPELYERLWRRMERLDLAESSSAQLDAALVRHLDHFLAGLSAVQRRFWGARWGLESEAETAATARLAKNAHGEWLILARLTQRWRSCAPLDLEVASNYLFRAPLLDPQQSLPQFSQRLGTPEAASDYLRELVVVPGPVLPRSGKRGRPRKQNRRRGALPKAPPPPNSDEELGQTLADWLAPALRRLAEPDRDLLQTLLGIPGKPACTAGELAQQRQVSRQYIDQMALQATKKMAEALPFEAQALAARIEPLTPIERRELLRPLTQVVERPEAAVKLLLRARGVHLQPPPAERRLGRAAGQAIEHYVGTHDGPLEIRTIAREAAAALGAKPLEVLSYIRSQQRHKKLRITDGILHLQHLLWRTVAAHVLLQHPAGLVEAELQAAITARCAKDGSSPPTRPRRTIRQEDPPLIYVENPGTSDLSERLWRHRTYLPLPEEQRAPLLAALDAELRRVRGGPRRIAQMLREAPTLAPWREVPPSVVLMVAQHFGEELGIRATGVHGRRWPAALGQEEKPR